MADRSPDGHPVSPEGRSLDRQVLALAVPAFGALVAEPLFVLVDSAVVGRLGTAPLAGLALAGTVLATAVGLCVFLAYGTTAGVARALGAVRLDLAARLGVDALWLALGLGTLLGVGLWVTAPWLVEALGAPSDVAPHAVTYLRWSAPGLPGMLAVLAATGALRGRLDTRTPLAVAVGGAVLNAILTVVLVLGVGMGVAGSGLGTAVTQLLMGAVLARSVLRAAAAAGAPRRPSPSGLLGALRTGGPLLARTASLRVAVLLATWVAAGLGTVALAGHQVVGALWALAAFALDSLAIAAQALVGHRLGAGDVVGTRATLRHVLRWGIGGGAVLGLVVGATGWWLALPFTSDPEVRRAVAAALVVVAVSLPVAGAVFVLDGVLIGAGDGRHLAVVGVLTLLAYAPVAVAVRANAPQGAVGLVWSWAAFTGVFMLSRALTTGLRAAGTGWMRTGA